MGESVNRSKHKVAICGATGFVGTYLSRHLISAGCMVIPLGRELFKEGSFDDLVEIVAQCDTVINVAGATIDKRWTSLHKQLMYESRIGVTRSLVRAIERCGSVSTWICASAIGFYPSHGCYDESFVVSGNDFLAQLCLAWEYEAHQAPTHVRTITPRFGVVMAPKGGAFESLSRPSKMGMAVVVGSGQQPFTWIDVVDLCRALEFLIDSDLQGVFNLVAPQQITLHDAVKLIKCHYKAPFMVRIPGWLLRTARGEAANFLLKGQCVFPIRLLEVGFKFETPDFQSFLCRI